jgi:hypothetical protein
MILYPYIKNYLEQNLYHNAGNYKHSSHSHPRPVEMVCRMGGQGRWPKLLLASDPHQYNQTGHVLPSVTQSRDGDVCDMAQT